MTLPVIPPTSLLTTPTNTNAATTNTGSIRVIVGAAIAAVTLVAIIVSSTAIFGAAVCVKVKRQCSLTDEGQHVAKNEEYGAKVSKCDCTQREHNYYDHPTTQYNVNYAESTAAVRAWYSDII